MDNLDLMKKGTKKMLERIDALKREGTEEYEFQPQKYANGQEKELKRTLTRAQKDNENISIALENADSLKLDVSEKARLRSIQGRNLSHQILNNERFRKDSPEMEAVKNSIDELEKALTAPIWKDIKADDEDGEKDKSKKMSYYLNDIGYKYQEAIVACRKYLAKKTPNSPKGKERYRLVHQKFDHLMEESLQLNVARQFLFRGKIGLNAKNVRDLIAESRVFISSHKEYTQEDNARFEKEANNTYLNHLKYSDIRYYEFDKMEGAQKLFFDVMRLVALPDARVEVLGKKNKAKTINTLKTIRDHLASFKPGKPCASTILVDDKLFNIFQNEDNTLSIVYAVKTSEGMMEKTYVLKTDAKTLADRMGMNMLEHEDIFGRENSSNIMKSVELINADTPLAEKMRASDMASALLRTRLGVVNQELTNIPHEFRVQLAKALEEGSVTPENALSQLRDYEYGDKTAKKTAKKNKQDKLKKDISDLDVKARELGYKDMAAMMAEEKEKERLQELTKEENEKLEKEMKEKKASKKLISAAKTDEPVKKHKDPYVSSKYIAADVNTLLEETMQKIINNTNRLKAAQDTKINTLREKRTAIEARRNAPRENDKRVQAEYDALEKTYIENLQKQLEEYEKEYEDNLKALKDDPENPGLIERQKEDLKDKYEKKVWKLDKDSRKWINKTDREKEIKDRKADRAYKSLDVQIKKLDARIHEEELKKHRIDTDFTHELALYDIWKDYYILTSQRKRGNETTIKLTAAGANMIDATERGMRYEEWKVEWQKQLEESNARRQRELAETSKKEEKRKDLLEKYEDLILDLKELNESDISRTTDEKINGEDTLDLLRYRKLREADGTLKEKVIFTEDVEMQRLDEEENECRTRIEDLEKSIRAEQDKAAEKRKQIDEKKRSIDKVTQEIDEIEKSKKLIKEDMGGLRPDQMGAVQELITLNRDQMNSDLEVIEDVYRKKGAELQNKIEICKHKLATAGTEKAKKSAQTGLDKLEELADKLRQDLEEKEKKIQDSYNAVLTRLGDSLEDKQKAFSEYDAALKELEGKKLSEKKYAERRDILRKEYDKKIADANEAAMQKETGRHKLNEELKAKVRIMDATLADKKLLKEAYRVEQTELDKDIVSYERNVSGYRGSLNDKRKDLETVRQKRQAILDEKAKQQAEKKKAVEEGTEWNEREQAFINFFADLIYSEKTWEMDTQKLDGERIFRVLKRNRSQIVSIINNDDGFKRLKESMVKKLPLEAMGLKEDEVLKLIDDYRDRIDKMISNGIEDRKKDAAARNKEREKRRKDKEKEIKKARAQWKKEKEERMRKFPKIKKYMDSLEGDFSPMQVLEAAEKERKEDSGLINFFSGLFKNKSPEEEAREEETNALIEELEELASQEKEQEAAWAAEIKEAGEDDELQEDYMLLKMPDAMIKTFAVNEIFKGEYNEHNETYSMLKGLEKKVDTMMHKAIRGMQKTMTDFVQNKMGGTGSDQAVEHVDYYREDNITSEERKQRIEKGRNALNTMINNAMTGQEGQGQFVRNAMADYLSGCSGIDLRCMLSSAIRNMKPVKEKEGEAEVEKLRKFNSFVGGVFKGAGPLMQKILQGMPVSLMPEGLQESLEDVKSDLAPIPREIVEAQLLSMVERSEGKLKRIEVVKSLGAASVGQAFLCNAYDKRGSAHKVVIKLLRPDVRNRMMREKEIMLKAAEKAGKGMKKTYEGLLERYLEELDLTIEARNCEVGEVYDNKKKDISSMKVSRFANATPNSMMVELADGDTVVGTMKKSRKLRNDLLKQFFTYDKEGKQEMEGDEPKLTVSAGDDVQEIKAQLSQHLSVLQRQQKMLCDMANKWVTEAIFGKGFYHGDLHAGNIMISETGLTVIDFGNATKLDEFQQKTITAMLMAAAAGSGEGFMKGFEALLSEKSKPLLKQKRGELLDTFREVMHLGDFFSAGERIAAALVRAQKLGFELPPSIYGFQQCEMRVMLTIQEFNNEIIKVQDTLKRLQKVQDDTHFSVKADYNRAKLGTDNHDMFMKLGMLTDNEEDMMKLLRDKNSRKLLNSFFDKFDEVNIVKKMDSETMDQELLQKCGGEAKTYSDKWISMVIRREDWVKCFEGYGLYVPANERAVNRMSDKDRMDHIAAYEKLTPEKKKEICDKIRSLMDKYDVKGALEKLQKAQDDGNTPEEELRALEQNAFKIITAGRKAMLEMKRFNMYNDYKRDFDGDFDDEKELDAKIREFMKDTTYYTDPALFLKNIRDNFKDEKKLPKAETELKGMFDNPLFGNKLKTAFEAYKTAVADKADNTEQLLDALMEIYSITAVMDLKESGSATKEKEINYKAPEDFVSVMGDVLTDNCDRTLASMNLKEKIKYGWRIGGDKEGRNLGAKDIIPFIKKIMKDEE